MISQTDIDDWPLDDLDEEEATAILAEMEILANFVNERGELVGRDTVLSAVLNLAENINHAIRQSSH